MGPAEETVAARRYEDGGSAVAADLDLNEDGAVDEADGEFAAQTGAEGIASTPEEGTPPGTGAGDLPSTGGVLPMRA